MPESPRVPRVLGALSGLLAAAVAIGAAELIAGVIGPGSAPLVAIGGVVVDASPHAVTEFAIRTFGTNDKLALTIGTGVLLAILAGAIGAASLRSRRLGVTAIALLAVLGAVAAATRPDGGPMAVLPSLLGALAGAGTLVVLLEALSPQSMPAPAGRDPNGGIRASLASSNRKAAGLDRRAFFLTAGAAGAVAIVTGGAAAALGRRYDVSQARAQLRVPIAAATTAPVTSEPTTASVEAPAFQEVPGLSPLLTSNTDFYRVDTALAVPQISPDEWSLRIHGRVGRELTFSFGDLAGRADLIEADIALACVSNEVGGPLAGAARWVGVPLAGLLAEAGVEPGAVQVVTSSIDGYTCGTPTADCMSVPNAMLALSMNGEPLPVEHGFPVRMIVPGLYGYVSATKWIVDMELTSFADFDPYWVRRGWERKGPIQTFSRIDTPQPARSVAAGSVPIAGVALSGEHGIGAVELSIDNGPWQQAGLAPQTTVQLWRQWMLPWHAVAGVHSIAVRATDGDGRLQSGQQRAPYPNAASGWHTIQVSVA